MNKHFVLWFFLVVSNCLAQYDGKTIIFTNPWHSEFVSDDYQIVLTGNVFYNNINTAGSPYQGQKGIYITDVNATDNNIVNIDRQTSLYSLTFRNPTISSNESFSINFQLGAENFTVFSMNDYEGTSDTMFINIDPDSRNGAQEPMGDRAFYTVNVFNYWEDTSPKISINGADYITMGPNNEGDLCGWYQYNVFEDEQFSVSFQEQSAIGNNDVWGASNLDFNGNGNTVYIYADSDDSPVVSYTKNAAVLANQGLCELKLAATVRDFSSSHQFFENNAFSYRVGMIGDNSGLITLDAFTGIVNTTLDDETKKPTLTNDGIDYFNNRVTYSRDRTINEFDSLFAKRSNNACTDLVMGKTADGMWEIDSENNGYFPVDDIAGAELTFSGDYNSSHNFGFCLETHATFVYKKGQIFTFSGDDDVWVYINNQLVIDLGGVHQRVDDSIFIDDIPGITEGDTLDFDLFYCERQTSQSNLKIKTSINFNQNRFLSLDSNVTNSSAFYSVQNVKDATLSCEDQGTDSLVTAGDVNFKVTIEDANGVVSEFDVDNSNWADVFTITDSTLTLDKDLFDLLKAGTYTIVAIDKLDSDIELAVTEFVIHPKWDLPLPVDGSSIYLDTGATGTLDQIIFGMSDTILSADWLAFYDFDIQWNDASGSLVNLIPETADLRIVNDTSIVWDIPDTVSIQYGLTSIQDFSDTITMSIDSVLLSQIDSLNRIIFPDTIDANNIPIAMQEELPPIINSAFLVEGNTQDSIFVLLSEQTQIGAVEGRTNTFQFKLTDTVSTFEADTIIWFADSSSALILFNNSNVESPASGDSLRILPGSSDVVVDIPGNDATQYSRYHVLLEKTRPVQLANSGGVFADIGADGVMSEIRITFEDTIETQFLKYYSFEIPWQNRDGELITIALNASDLTILADSVTLEWTANDPDHKRGLTNLISGVTDSAVFIIDIDSMTQDDPFNLIIKDELQETSKFPMNDELPPVILRTKLRNGATQDTLTLTISELLDTAFFSANVDLFDFKDSTNSDYAFSPELISWTGDSLTTAILTYASTLVPKPTEGDSVRIRPRNFSDTSHIYVRDLAQFDASSNSKYHVILQSVTTPVVEGGAEFVDSDADGKLDLIQVTLDENVAIASILDYYSFEFRWVNNSDQQFLIPLEANVAALTGNVLSWGGLDTVYDIQQNLTSLAFTATQQGTLTIDIDGLIAEYGVDFVEVNPALVVSGGVATPSVSVIDKMPPIITEASLTRSLAGDTVRLSLSEPFNSSALSAGTKLEYFDYKTSTDSTYSAVPSSIIWVDSVSILLLFGDGSIGKPNSQDSVRIIPESLGGEIVIKDTVGNDATDLSRYKMLEDRIILIVPLKNGGNFYDSDVDGIMDSITVEFNEELYDLSLLDYMDITFVWRNSSNENVSIKLSGLPEENYQLDSNMLFITLNGMELDLMPELTTVIEAVTDSAIFEVDMSQLEALDNYDDYIVDAEISSDGQFIFGMNDKLPPVLTEAAIIEHSQNYTFLRVKISESIDTNAIIDDVDVFTFKIDDIETDIIVEALSWGQLNSSVVIAYDNVLNPEVPNIGDSIKMVPLIDKLNGKVLMDKYGNDATELTKYEVIFDSSGVEINSDKVKTYDPNDPSLDRENGITVLVGDEIPGDNGIGLEISKIISSTVGSSDDIEKLMNDLGDISIRYAFSIYDQIGSFVISDKNTLSCDKEPLKDVVCSVEERFFNFTEEKIKLSWNYTDQVGRKVGDGPYIIRIELDVSSPANRVIVEELFTIGIMRKD